MRKVSFLLVLMVICLVLPGFVLADSDRIYDVGMRAATVGMDLLNSKPGDENILGLTNAGHALVKGKTTERALSGIMNVSGLNTGDGNLFQVNRPNWKPLWFYFFSKKIGLAAYMEVDPATWTMSDEELAALASDKAFSQISLMQVDIDNMLAHPDDGNATFNKKKFGGNEFSLIGLSNVWAKGASYDFMNAAAFHDHLCPGVTSGYMIIKYVEKALPITNSSETYIDIGSPNWCKEDAFQMIWDSTPGKSSEYVMALSPEDEAVLKAKYKTRPAGIIIKWNDASKTGKGLALGFDFDKVSEDTGVANWTGPSWAPKIVQDIGMMAYTENPEPYVSTLKEFTVDEVNLTKLKTAGNNPYKVLGML